MTPTPDHLIARALALVKYNQRVLAVHLQMTKSRVNRVIKGGRLSLENCLGLADIIDEDPAVVLRAYGYDRQADILDRANRRLGRRHAATVRMLDEYDGLDSGGKRVVRGVTSALHGVNRKRKTKPSR